MYVCISNYKSSSFFSRRPCKML